MDKIYVGSAKMSRLKLKRESNQIMNFGEDNLGQHYNDEPKKTLHISQNGTILSGLKIIVFMKEIL